MAMRAGLLWGALVAVGWLGGAARPVQGQEGKPFVHRQLYPEASEAATDIAGALKQARAEHKRVLLVFGGNWCSDCVVLNMKLHDAENLPLLEKAYVLVHVNVGHMDENVELAQRYGIRLTHGVPAVSVVSATGKVVHAQPNEDAAAARHLDSQALHAFLTQWKG